MNYLNDNNKNDFLLDAIDNAASQKSYSTESIKLEKPTSKEEKNIEKKEITTLAEKTPVTDSDSNANFAFLRVYSEYSLLHSCLKAYNLASYCKEFGVNTIALTDMHNMFGMLKFHSIMAEHKIKPIVGCTLHLFDNFEVWAYCKNETGYVELSNLISFSYLEKNGKLAVNDLLALKNCIILFDHRFPSAELDQFIASARSENIEIAIAISRQVMDLEFEQSLFEISRKFDLPIVAAPRFFYEKPEQKLAVDTLMCIKNGAYLVQQDRPQVIVDGNLQDPALLEKKFADIPQAIENMRRIAQKCNFVLKAHAPRMPGINSNEDPEVVFHRMIFTGLEMRFEKDIMPEYAVLPQNEQEEIRKIYIDRANYEFEMIKKMGFCEYFLIVSDIVQWSKNNDIPVGPGRGSGASSLVAWCLQITNLNPIKYHLMFERFLNPDRVSLPDFDIDFCQEKRHKVIEYIQTRFGKENVAHIITFGSLQYRAAIKDVGRVMQMPYSLIDKLCKTLPQPVQGVAPTLKQLKESGVLQEFINAETEDLFKIALEVEGLPRHCSMHAAGLVIGNQKLADIVPLFKEVDSEIPIVQFDMKMAEKIGLVKFDILGLAVLSILHKTCEFLKAKNIDLDLDHIPLDDAKTFQTLQKGMVKGVFQFESLGFKQLMLEMQPTRLEDLIAAGALYRPGPMGDIPQFIKCKKDTSQIEYMFPQMEPILKDTYGVIVYQEQVLQIAKDLAGYSLKEADLLRRAMGKKIKAEMAMHQEKFVNGMVETIKSPRDKAQQLFDNLARFASYGFNKGHAAPYGMMSYQTAYCKTNYTHEFLCACLFYEQVQEKSEELIQEAIKMGVTVNPPCLNKSLANFALNDAREIMFGLSKVKGVGEIANEIIANRNELGPFKSIEDFIKRINPNKRVLENFVYTGVFDCFGKSRDEQLKEITSPKQELSLFDFDDEITNSMTTKEIMKHEFDLMQTIFSKDSLKSDLSQFKIKNKLTDIDKPGGLLFCMGLQPNVRKTKDGRTMNSYKFFDLNGAQEVLINTPCEITWDYVIIEFERNNIRYTIKKVTPFSTFWNNFKKMVLSADSLDMQEILRGKINELPEGDTSIYIEFEGKNQFIGNFILNIDFLNSVKSIQNEVIKLLE